MKAATKATKKAPNSVANSPFITNRQLTARKKAMVAALESCMGIVTHAAQKVGIDRDCHYSWIKKDPEYKKAVEALDDAVLDFAESSLYQQVKEKNTAATLFLLKCRGKRRGYVEREVFFEPDNSNLQSFLDAIKPPPGLLPSSKTPPSEESS